MEDRYIRVATTLYKIVRKPLLSGDFMELRVPWNYETLRQDETKDFISQIKKYDGFCCVPSHTNYQRTIGTFLNDYEPVEIEPQQGQFLKVETFLRHIFGEQYEMGLDYLQLLYTQPLQRFPIILLVSKEKNTGKTTFLNLLKAIFGANMTFNTNEDFRSQFNSDWATKLIVAVDEVLLDRKEDSERIKNLSTARSYKSEAKGKDRNEVEFFAKFVLNSNNELNPIYIEQGETRYWVRKIPTLASDNPNLLSEMKKELPALLWHLLHRKLTTTKESRMWFRHDLLITNALRKMINHNRNKAENEMLQILAEIMEVEQLTELMFCVVDMVSMLDVRGIRVEHPHLRRILQHNWELQPSPTSQYYSTYALRNDGSTERKTATGRYYTITKERLNAILLVC
ncbi:hypothetical protein BN938_0451 [Mucinivorans hirudinis]|uniref:SF3 helicase domain-containing protein n=1 Tax=Mucinivorans hirudinis TaxID=1433126 RepID=A0A060R6A5_9BACT|nr:hypothetical protein BN938_0451 [Mucinivorans hirudinis]